MLFIKVKVCGVRERWLFNRCRCKPQIWHFGFTSLPESSVTWSMALLDFATVSYSKTFDRGHGHCHHYDWSPQINKQVFECSAYILRGCSHNYWWWEKIFTKLEFWIFVIYLNHLTRNVEYSHWWTMYMTLVNPTEEVMFGQFCNFAEFLRILALLNWVTLEYIPSPSQHVI